MGAEPLLAVGDQLQVGVRGQLVVGVVLAIYRNPENESPAFDQRLGGEDQQVGQDVAEVIVDLKSSIKLGCDKKNILSKVKINELIAKALLCLF